jgi:hypothetical protein
MLELPPDWAQGGVAGLSLAALVYVFLGMRKLFREFMVWTGNHMSCMVKALVDNATAQEKMASALEDMVDVVRELNARE